KKRDSLNLPFSPYFFIILPVTTIMEYDLPLPIDPSQLDPVTGA
uniref:Ovule protein n=1 Tax=Steinernema glaseri TaxID=37863 RepID=A0A1I7Z444_9BILA